MEPLKNSPRASLRKKVNELLSDISQENLAEEVSNTSLIGDDPDDEFEDSPFLTGLVNNESSGLLDSEGSGSSLFSGLNTENDNDSQEYNSQRVLYNEKSDENLLSEANTGSLIDFNVCYRSREHQKYLYEKFEYFIDSLSIFDSVFFILWISFPT